jgi:hypothetical protein
MSMCRINSARAFGFTRNTLIASIREASLMEDEKDAIRVNPKALNRL